jgi:hypothetical protein
VRRLRGGPLLAIVSYAASPAGRRRLGQLRRRLDTPENRRRAVEAKDRLVASAQRRKR